MPTVPNLQVLYRRNGDIMFGWKPLKRNQAKYYKLYASATATGAYTLVQDKIPNEVDKTVYRGKVVYQVKDSDIPILPNPQYPSEQGGVVPHTTRYYFKLTFVDPTSTESSIASSPATLVLPPQIEPFFENEDEVKNNHNMVWVEERKRWEKMRANEDGELVVDANVTVGDITVENIKVAARPDGTTLEYILVDSERKVIVRPDPNSVSRISDYEETTAIQRNTETIILTYTNASDYFVEKVVCSGTGDGKYKLKIDGTTARTLRNAWNDRNVTFDYTDIHKKIPANSIVTITVEHNEPNTHSYEANLEGYTFSIV